MRLVTFGFYHVKVYRFTFVVMGNPVTQKRFPRLSDVKGSICCIIRAIFRFIFSILGFYRGFVILQRWALMLAEFWYLLQTLSNTNILNNEGVVCSEDC